MKKLCLSLSKTIGNNNTLNTLNSMKTIKTAQKVLTLIYLTFAFIVAKKVTTPTGYTYRKCFENGFTWKVKYVLSRI